MTLSIGRIARAIIVGVLTTALIAMWRSGSGSEVDSLPDQALTALAFAIGWYVGDLLKARFVSRRKPVRRRSIIVWTLAMAVFVSLLFVSIGLLNGADWTMSQWRMAVVSGGLIGSLFGALSAWVSNAANVPREQTV